MVLINAAINATERQDVSAIDAPGAFMTEDMEEEAVVILEDEIVNAILEIDKDVYERYVIHGKNEKNTYTSASARQCMGSSRQNSYIIGNYRKN